MKNLLKVLGLVLVLALTVTPVMADPDVDPNPGNGNTDVIIMNMGSAATEATLMYYNSAGISEAPVVVPLAAKGSYRDTSRAASPLGDQWQGFTDTQLQALLTGAGLIDVRVRVGARTQGDPFVVLLAVGTKPRRRKTRP